MAGQAVILCGGRGLRLDPLTDETPKPLIEVGGIPFVLYAINMLKGLQVIKDIVILAGYKIGKFNGIQDSVVRIVPTEERVNNGVLGIPNLQDRFLLLNGDCFPIMDWRAFVDGLVKRVAVKIVGRDAGIAIVEKADAVSGYVDCGNIKDMVGKYENYTILGGLHIGTPQGLQRARAFMDLVVYGQ